METRPDQRNRWAGALLLAAAILLGPLSALSQSPPGARVKRWKVKGSNLVLSLEEGQLISRSKEGLVDVISLSTITELDRETKTRKPVAETIEQIYEDNDWENLEPQVSAMLAQAQDPRMVVATVGAVPLIPLIATAEVAVMWPFRGVTTHQHFVQIIWGRDGQEEIRLYQLSARDAQTLLAALEDVTGKQEIEYAPLKDLQDERVLRMTVRLPEGTAVGRTFLTQGTYQAAFVPRTERTGILYFFFGERSKPEGVLAASTVEVTGISPDEPPQALFGTDANGDRYLAELRVNSKSLRLRGEKK